MKLAAIAEALALKPVTGDHGQDKEVTGGYVGDLLSHVMSRSRPGNIWVTIQSHPNVVAVATLVGLSGVVIAEGVAVDTATIQKAREEHVSLFTTGKSAFAVVADLVAAGVGPSE